MIPAGLSTTEVGLGTRVLRLQYVGQDDHGIGNRFASFRYSSRTQMLNVTVTPSFHSRITVGSTSPAA
jgi:hypothetical protein